MAVEFRHLLDAEVDGLAAFLAAAFRSDPGAPFLDRRLLQWKYFEPVPGWPAPRSYVLKNGPEFLAHGCIYPVTFLATQGEPVTGMRVIDWAGAPGLPGAGVLLWKKLQELTETMLGVGGTAATRTILPKIGLRRQGSQKIYARVIRPLRQFREYASWHWKTPLRLVRNVVWSLPAPALPAGWSVRRVPSFDETMAPLFPQPCEAFVPTGRSAGLLNYLLACPGAHCAAFLLCHGPAPSGYFLLNQVGPQARIVDLWVNGGADAWEAAYAAAGMTAARNPDACEIVAAASTPLLCRVLTRLGFRLRAEMPIFLNDPHGKLCDAPPLHLNLADGDEFHTCDPAVRTLT